MMKARLFALVAALLLLTGPLSASAQDPTGTVCNDAGIFSRGNLIAAICPSCFFPIKIGPVVIQGGAGGGTPWGSTQAPTCTCPGRLFGYPTTGPVLSMWQPTNVIELTRMPGCSPSLGGEMLPGFSTASMARGSWGASRQNTADPVKKSQAFYNAHLLIFPVGQILSTMVDSVCTGGGGADVQLAYITEVDPTWSNDTLALHTVPDAVLFSSLPAVAACMVDAVSASTLQPIDLLFWCAGSWGHLYPFHGFSNQDAASPPRETSLIATKLMAAMHRRPPPINLNITMGPTAVCTNHPSPTMLKGQFKLNIMHPIPESTSNHWLGASTFRWGEWRNTPGVGEDFVNLVWTYEQCCGNL